MFVWGLPPSLTCHKHKARCGLIEWLDTELYLFLRLSISTTLLLANIKIDHSRHVKCERISVDIQQTNYVICCLRFRTEKSMHLCISPQDWVRCNEVKVHFKIHWLEDIVGNHHVATTCFLLFCPKISCHSFSCQAPNLMKSGNHFKQYINPHHNRRSLLIGSPLHSLSSLSLHRPHKSTIVHHTPNLFCHFSLGLKIRARRPYWFYKKHEAQTPEVECLPVIDNCSNNHDSGREGGQPVKKKDDLMTGLLHRKQYWQNNFLKKINFQNCKTFYMCLH